MKYKMIIAYDGTGYGGWQIQKNAPSIQETIQNTLAVVLRTPTHLTGSGRTDAGVHAHGQTAHFTHEEPLDLYKLTFSLNSLLPKDIRICAIEPVAEDFHARYSAKRKIYSYHLHLDPIEDPFLRLYRYHIKYKIDLSLLRSAATHFIGTHDFTSFSNEAHRGSAAKDPIRTLYRLDLIEEEGGLKLEFEGDGFLYKMVRNIVGTLLDIGSHKIPLEKLPVILSAKDRKLAGSAAPPHGLFLSQVIYNY